ncbi:MAG: aconitate hydratase, partial [Burkholderiales bacterium]
GSGSSRDWAAKGPALLGVKAIIARSYERIHRSNLLCMGILPLQFAQGDSAQSLGLTGDEAISITGLAGGIAPRQQASVSAARPDGTRVQFETTVRIDAPAELEYFLNGGILQMVLRRLLSA